MKDWLKLQNEQLLGKEVLNVITSDFRDGVYSKHFICEEFEMWEENSIVLEEVTSSYLLHGINVTITSQVKFVKHEMWNTIDFKSYVAYERLEG